MTRIPLADAAVSTSGDYERYFDEDGVRYHHIIDPHTGHSANKVRSATIIGPTATQTDGLSKTAFVLGAEKTLEIINRMPEFDAVFVTPGGPDAVLERPPAAQPATARGPARGREPLAACTLTAGGAGAVTGGAPGTGFQQRVHLGLRGQPVFGLVARGEPAALGTQVCRLGDHRPPIIRGDGGALR